MGIQVQHWEDGPSFTFGTSFHSYTLVGIYKTWVSCPEPIRNVTDLKKIFYLKHFRWFYAPPLLSFCCFFPPDGKLFSRSGPFLKRLQPVISVGNLAGPGDMDSAICAKPNGRYVLHCVQFACLVFSFFAFQGMPVKASPSPHSLQFLSCGHYRYIYTYIITFLWPPH